MLSLCSAGNAQLVFCRDCLACVLQVVLSLCPAGNAQLVFLGVLSGSAQLMFLKGKLTLCSGSAKLVFYRECYAFVLEELVFCKDCSACALR
jgi:hypothetical protein